MKKSISPSNVRVAIDIGTTKICVLIAHCYNNEQFEIVGIGKAPSKGLARGVVVDIGPATKSIKSAIEEAELMAGCSIESAYIGISGAHIAAYNSSGMIPVKHGEIRESDVKRVIAAAQAVPLAEGEKILHVMPQRYIIDQIHTVQDPIGMHGVRLEAHVHIITGGVTSVQNLVRCCELANVKVRDIILEPLGSADAVLSQDEKELGIGLLDIGGGTADFAVYHNGSIRHTRILPIAGNLFTQDIALCLKTTKADAERIKTTLGTVLSNDMPHHSTCSIATIDGEGEQFVSTQDVLSIVSPRSQELMSLVAKEIETYKLHDLMPAGLVITGGGALLHGLTQHATEIIHMPARIGLPKVPETFEETMRHPTYATGYGLLVHALHKKKYGKNVAAAGPLMNRVFWKMKSWISDLF